VLCAIACAAIKREKIDDVETKKILDRNAKLAQSVAQQDIQAAKGMPGSAQSSYAHVADSLRCCCD